MGEPSQSTSHQDTETESIIDIRTSLKKFCESFDEIKQQNASTNRRISELTAVIKDKDAIIEKLESQINDLAQNSKRKNVITTGLNLHTYVTMLVNATFTMPSTQHSDNNVNATMNTNFVTFAKEKLGTIFEPYDITAVHDLPPRRGGTRPQLFSAEKATLMSKRGSLRGTSIYSNDHLSAFNSELFLQARQLKRDGKIHAAWSRGQ